MDEPEEAIEVPHTRIDAPLLQRVLEEFVTRDGTDYGGVERSLPEKVADVRSQLERGEAVIVYDPASETINVIARRSRRARD
jgi:uncharacterized protein